jgi:Tfp pilus assembly protein PilN
VGNVAVRGVISHLLFTACLGLILLSGWGFYYYQGRIQNEAQTREIQAKADALQAEIEKLSEGVPDDIDTTLFTDPMLLDIFQELASKLPEAKVQIREIRVAQPGGRGGWITVSGTATDAAAFNEAYEQLRGSAMFKVDEQPNIAVQGTQTTFSFRANRIESEGTENEPSTT